MKVAFLLYVSIELSLSNSLLISDRSTLNFRLNILDSPVFNYPRALLETDKIIGRAQPGISFKPGLSVERR